MGWHSWVRGKERRGESTEWEVQIVAEVREAIMLTPNLTPGSEAPKADALQLSVLGPPIVRVGDCAVAFRTRKEFALLTYLALSRTPRSREHLASLLWPDRDESSSRGTLRTALSRLRRAVAAAAGSPGHALTLFRTERDALGRDVISLTDQGTPRLTLDTALVETGAASKGEAMDSLAHEARLLAAVNAYRGPFLAEVTFDDAPELEDWVYEQRTFWQRQIEAVLGQLAVLQLERRALVEAGMTAERWIGIDPLGEAAYRALMRARAGTGDPAGAMLAYEKCRATLRSKLDVDPAPETVALAERQRRLVAESARRTPLANGADQAPSRAAVPDPRALELPFVGREREFAALVEAYQTARGGQTQVVVIQGEAKIGKTRLVEEFLRWAILEGADVVQARGLAMGKALPYQIVVDALRPRLAREHAPEDLVADVWLSELVRLFPELRERYPDLPAPAERSDDTTGPGRLFEAVHQFDWALAERARPGALVTFYDDLQWSDRTSLDLFLHGAQRGHETGLPGLAVVTVRTEALATTHELEGWLTRLARSAPTERLVLGPLDRAETEQAFETLLPSAAGVGGESSWSLVRALHDQTDGHPFYLIETLRELVAHGILVARDDAADPGRRAPLLEVTSGIDRLPRLVPETVRELIHDQLGELGPAAFDLLAAKVELGTGTNFERLCEVAELDDWAGLAALDQLRGRHLLVEDGGDLVPGDEQPDQAVTYRFPYGLVRQVVATEVGSSRRRVVHRRALASRGRGRATPANLLHRVLTAGPTDSDIRQGVDHRDAEPRSLRPA